MNVIYESGAFIDHDAVMKYVYLVNDLNAICFVDAVAQQFGFSKAIIPNLLLSSYVSTVLTDFYGEGTHQSKFEIEYERQIPVESGIKIQLFDEKRYDDFIYVSFTISEETIKRKGGVNYSTFTPVAQGRVRIKPGLRNFEKTN